MNAQIKNPAQAKAAAQQILNTTEYRQEQDRVNFKNIIDEISKFNPEAGDFDTLATLLSLPDEQFALLAPIFLREMAQGYNRVNDKMLIVRAMNASGLKAEDAQQEYVQICAEIDSQMSEVIPPLKRDFLKQLLGMTYNAIAETEGVAKKTLFIPIEYCRENAKTPEYAHLTDSGMDVFATEDITINPGETKLIPIGIKVAVPTGYELQVRPKSGRSLKSKLRIANTPGTIDAGYRDEIGIIVDNIDSTIRSADIDENGRLYNVLWGSSIHIEKGEKIAQLVLCEVPKACFYEVKKVSEVAGNRGGGFGSTGYYGKDDPRFGTSLV